MSDEVVSRQPNWAALRRLQLISLVVGIGGLLLSGIDAFTTRVPALQSWLFGWVFWTGLTLGCFGLMLFHHTIRGLWGQPIIRMLQAGARNLWLMAVLFLPILLVGMDIYPWTHAGAQDDPVIAHKRLYMNPAFFTFRWALFFAIWIGITWIINRWDTLQERTGDWRYAIKRTNLAAPCMVLFTFTLTLAYTDWVMSLLPHWYSTIWGLIALVGTALSALSFIVVVLMGVTGAYPWSDAATSPRETRDLGNMLLTLTILWAYVSFSQWLLIWMGNLPQEITYYTQRVSNGWRFVGTAIIVGQFFLPFLFLLSNKAKLSPRLLAGTALLILLARVVDIFWMITPSFGRVDVTVRWTDITALLGIGGIWIALFVWQFRRYPVLPNYDPRLAAEMETAEHA